MKTAIEVDARCLLFAFLVMMGKQNKRYCFPFSEIYDKFVIFQIEMGEPPMSPEDVRELLALIVVDGQLAYYTAPLDSYLLSEAHRI